MKKRSIMCAVVLAVLVLTLSGCATPPPISSNITLSIPEGLTNEQVLDSFRTAFNDVFKRYNPLVSTDVSSATGTAAFGKYPVEFTLDTADGKYEITGSTGLQKQGHLEKWLTNVRKRTETYCQRLTK